MSTLDLKIRGLPELEAKLLDLGAQMGIKALAQGARKAFKPVLEAAKQNVPIWSGALRESIKLTVKKTKTDDTVLVVGLYIGKATGPDLGELPAARRWHFIELGTSKYAAHPYLRPALAANASEVLESLKTEIAAAIERAVKRQAKGPK